MSTREFLVRIRGLPDDAPFVRVLAAVPVEASTPGEIAGLFGSFNGGPVTAE